MDLDIRWAVGQMLTIKAVLLYTKAAPEPGTLAAFGLGLAELGWVRRRKSAAS